MLGKRNGIAIKIAERNPYLFTTHCIAHRLALACNSAEKQVFFCKHVENIMKSVYSFFSSSSKRQETLRQYQTVLDHPILKIQQIHEIRWLSWYEAVKNLCLTIEPLMDTLLEMSVTSNRNQKESIIQLYTQICDWKFLAVLFFLYDILGYLSNLSKIFQQRNIQISDINPVIEMTINKIRLEYLDFDDDGKLLLGENLNNFLTETPSELNVSIGAHELMWTEDYESDLISIISSFSGAVILEIQERFPNQPLLNAMKIFNHLIWPNDKELLVNYGEDELNILTEYYRAIIDDNVSEEWDNYKAIIYANYKTTKLELLLPKLFENYFESFPNILKLLSIIYSIPFSSVECERGFSKQNLIKTDLRNNLNNETLNLLMMIGLDDVDLLEFDFSRALEIWNSQCKRRI